jgi:hypothetical protein
MNFETFFSPPAILNKTVMFHFCTALRFKRGVTKASANKIEFLRVGTIHSFAGEGVWQGCGVKSCEMLRDT